MEKEKIVDVNRSEEENFISILQATENALKEAMEPFLYYFDFYDINEFMKWAHYDYDTLYTITVYGILNMLSITYSKDIPIKTIIDNMPPLDTISREEMYRKLISRLKETFSKRNEQHLSYFNQLHHEPRMMAADALWYDLLSSYPIIKRFLREDEAIITKKFFGDLNEIYSFINNNYKGYDRFYLRHKLEMSSKLELFYKILCLIKKEKRRLKLSDQKVSQMLEEMYKLHNIPCRCPGIEMTLFEYPYIDVYNEILTFQEYERTVNSISFNTNDIAMYYMEDREGAIAWTIFINLIHNAVVYHLSCKIEQELALAGNKIGFDLINKIQHCQNATAYFDEFMKSIKTINFENYKEDITYTHFKKVYHLKRERSKKND